MLRICHLADVHLGLRKYSAVAKSGFNQREVDISLAFRECIDRVVQIKPDITIIAGDLFHNVRPSNAILTLAFRELRRLSLVAPVVIVSGNHETPKKADVGNILKLFTEIPNIYVADQEQAVFTFPKLELAITALPHQALQDSELKIRAIDEYEFNVLISHGQIGDSWMSEFGGVEKKLSELSPHEFDYVALGHIHVVKQVELNTWFSGALEHTSSNIWSEAKDPKGFLEVIINKNPSNLDVKFHTLKSPREVVWLPAINASLFKDVEILNQKIFEALDNVPGGIDGKIIRQEVFDIPKEIFRSVSFKPFKEYKLRALHLQLELKLEVPMLSGAAHQGKIASKPLIEQLEIFTNEFRASKNAQTTSRIIDSFREYFKQLEAKEDEAA
jgi:exonuclease SbcD